MNRLVLSSLVSSFALLFVAACGNEATPPSFEPTRVVTAGALRAALLDAVGEPPYAAGDPDFNGGLSLNMWATVVDRNGIVVAVVFTGEGPGDQFPGSRIISAQKANTANAFSLSGLSLSTANLYALTQPGGSLFGLESGNPINEDVAYGGDAAEYGTANDFMIGKRIGGTNTFGGGLALYDEKGTIVGGLGVSGDTSCADHAIAWRVRHALNLDNLPGGVADAGKDDNIIYDMIDGRSAGGFGHPPCINPAGEVTVATSLPVRYPVGSAR